MATSTYSYICLTREYSPRVARLRVEQHVCEILFSHCYDRTLVSVYSCPCPCNVTLTR